jgi:cysteinyl-tRNA synthetase
MVGFEVGTRPDMDSEAAARAAAIAGKAKHDVRAGAGNLAFALTRTAQLLEQSATLAEQHARRLAEKGQEQAAEQERLTARRAHEASQRAWERAERFRELSGEAEPGA